VKMALSTQNVWWRNSSATGTLSGLFPRVRAYADPKPLPQAGGVRHRYTRTTPPHTHTIPRAPDAAPGPSTVIWLRKRRLAGHPKNVLKNAVARFDLPGKSGVVGLLYVRYPGSAMIP
jgi:hypothetical protein